MNHFILDGRYGDLLNIYGISIEEALNKAELPGDVFRRQTPSMTEEQYFRFMDAVGSLIDDPAIPIQIACANKIEFFSPPIFASYCSKNGSICIERLARYKRLIGPMIFHVIKTETETIVEITTKTGINEVPTFLVETEFAFLIGIIRKSTKEEIYPLSVQMIKPVTDEAFTMFLGVPVKGASTNSITFNNADLQIPFISYDKAMWNYFEPELSRRLSELDVDDSIAARVRSALTELLPGGSFGIEEVAKKLGLSKRTLQRKLEGENTTFQQQLNNTRELLAKHYIRNTEITTNDIAFLLGYHEINSFLRAFTVWTGMSISEFKKKD